MYLINFWNIHTFTYQKAVLHTLFCLFLKHSVALGVSLRLRILRIFFCLDFYSVTNINDSQDSRIRGRLYLFNSTLPLSPASQTFTWVIASESSPLPIASSQTRTQGVTKTFFPHTLTYSVQFSGICVTYSIV